MDQRIRYFLTAARMQSFSLAARELYISPQALTRQMTILEEELGAPLFDRTPKGVTLTPFGQLALTRLQEASDIMDAAVRDLKRAAAVRKTGVNIGIFSALPREHLVLPLVSYLLAAFPGYQFSLEMIELGEGKRRFEEGSLDFLLTNIHEQDDMQGAGRLVFGTYEAKVAVSLVHPWVIRDTITEADLRREPFIKMKMDADHYTVPIEESFYSNIPCSKVLEVTNFQTMMVMLGQGAGFAVIPMAFADTDRAQIKSFDYPGTPLRFEMALLYHSDSGIPGLGKIIQGIREEFID